MEQDRIFDIDYINAKIYFFENIDRHRQVTREYRKNRRETDHHFKTLCNMRSRLYLAFKNKNWKKGSSTSKLLGGSVEEVVSHIEAKFKNGMSWENYGKWHIDHIIPLSSAKTSDDMDKLCHFSNLQPLWQFDNIQKRNKLVIL